MKTLRIIGVALLMVLLNVGFSSCSKSDDDNSGSDSFFSCFVNTFRYVFN